MRPDLVVHMPEARDLVVDAKTPLDAYLEAIEATTTKRGASRSRATRSKSKRVPDLGPKSYWAQFERSPEFAVLFLPGDQFLSSALAERPELLETALKQGMIIATPSTLIALLKVVAYGWRQSAVAENAAEIRELGQELHKRLATFVGHIGRRSARSLGKALDAYNAAVGSLERKSCLRRGASPSSVPRPMRSPSIDPARSTRAPCSRAPLRVTADDEPATPRAPS